MTMRSAGLLAVACAAMVALAGCVESPVMMESRAPREVIDLRLGYPEAFDRVVRVLEREGYEIEAADERVGLIRTAPKSHAGTGGVSYKTAVIVRMGGTDRESWLAVDHVAIPTFPDEERKIEDVLKGIAK